METATAITLRKIMTTLLANKNLHRRFLRVSPELHGADYTGVLPSSVASFRFDQVEGKTKSTRRRRRRRRRKRETTEGEKWGKRRSGDKDSVI